MFLNSEKIYNVYEKPECAEPTERMALLREGFAFWAFSFGAIWLLAKRQWRMLVGYILIASIICSGSNLLGLPNISVILLMVWLNLMLGYHASDLRAWVLKRKGYRFAGVLAAESPMHAQRRYYEFAA